MTDTIGNSLDTEISFAVCGLTRESATYIRREVTRLNNLFPSNVEVVWHVVESDSQDSTLIELGKLSTSLANFTYSSLGQLAQALPDRTSRLAACRNKYLDWLNSLEKKPRYLLVLDLDRANPKLTWDTIQACLELDLDWDAIFANQKFYYDIFALRCTGWNDCDPFAQASSLEQIGFSFLDAVRLAVTDKMVSIPRSSRPIRVESAFGGAGIYKVKSLSRTFRYSGAMLGSKVSEHVPFHAAMVKEGMALFVVPMFYNAKYSEHSRIKHPVREAVHNFRRLLLRRARP